MIIIFYFCYQTKMMATIRIKGCKTKDIDVIITKIKNTIENINNNNALNTLMENAACIKAAEIIETYDISYCNTIIYAHSKSSVFQAIKNRNGRVDITNEEIFYRELAYPYLCSILYNKIHSQYNLNEMINSILTETKECSICLDCINNKNEIHLTNCNHCFHKKCFNKFIRYRGNRRCPNCRQSLF
jgi:hypothetical protein